ncbi:MAG: peptidoglycan-associated lipoprotein Pal [Burkholderiales bacterium]|nr:peptidoglycan-associated lipoprotein Pal [Burkholderiales bacterium]
MKKILAAIACAALVAACSTTPTDEGAAVESRTPGTGATGQAVPGGGVTGTPIGGGAVDPLKDPSSPLAKRSVYFDFDSDAIRAEFKPLLDAHAKYLRETAAAKTLLQGHADERGSREYNLALGQRRADAVRRYLVFAGAPESRIEAVSLGEEKPVCTEKTEECYARNRRVDILYQGEF